MPEDYLIGITISRSQTLDILVKVKAEDHKQAQKFALEEVKNQLFSGDLHIDYSADWEDGELDVEGVSNEDYEESHYAPDIDISDRPWLEPPDPNQLLLDI